MASFASPTKPILTFPIPLFVYFPSPLYLSFAFYIQKSIVQNKKKDIFDSTPNSSFYVKLSWSIKLKKNCNFKILQYTHFYETHAIIQVFCLFLAKGMEKAEFVSCFTCTVSSWPRTDCKRQSLIQKKTVILYLTLSQSLQWLETLFHNFRLKHFSWHSKQNLIPIQNILCASRRNLERQGWSIIHIGQKSVTSSLVSCTK